ncbi:MAG: hypothetical protein Q9170_006997 [Blastenia crenularia]
MKRKLNEDQDPTSPEIHPDDFLPPQDHPSSPSDIPHPEEHQSSPSESLQLNTSETPELEPSLFLLTTRNLRLLPGSPLQKAQAQSIMPDVNNDPVGVSSEATATPEQVRAFLRLHGMYFREEATLADYPTIKVAVNAVMSKHSDSSMEPESAEKINKYINKLQSRHEEKIFSKVWNRIFRKTHPHPDEDAKDTDKWNTDEWEVEHLDNNPNRQFHFNGVSNLNPKKNALHKKILDDTTNKIKRPKPDQTFGVEKAAFTDHEMLFNDTFKNLAGISDGILHAFLMVEFKGSAGDFSEAQNGALRASSTFVAANRRMRDYASIQARTQLGVDASSFVFSICMDPRNASLYVHFAEVIADDNTKTKTATKYNMVLVKNFTSSANDPGRSRAPLVVGYSRSN